MTAPSDNPKRPKRRYSEADKYIALAAVDLNASNVYRTSIALDVPYATLAGWVEDRRAGRLQGAVIQGLKETRGGLAEKLESLAHTIVEAMPTKVGKATLSQCAVTVGIAVDKVRILRGQGLDPDPAAELCRLLGINRKQLPERLELLPGEELPPGFEYLDTTATVINAPEPQYFPEPHSSSFEDPQPHHPDPPRTIPRPPIWEIKPETTVEGLKSEGTRPTDDLDKLLAGLDDEESSN